MNGPVEHMSEVQTNDTHLRDPLIKLPHHRRHLLRRRRFHRLLASSGGDADFLKAREKREQVLRQNPIHRRPKIHRHHIPINLHAHLQLSCSKRRVVSETPGLQDGPLDVLRRGLDRRVEYRHRLDPRRCGKRRRFLVMHDGVCAE